MVLESLIDPKKAEREEWELFFLGILYASFSLLVSRWIFKGYTSIVMVAITAICSVPLMFNIIKYEAEKDRTINSETRLLKEHSKAVSAFMFLFLGFVAAYLLWYLVLPQNVAMDAFKVQSDTISKISTGTPTGNMIESLGSLGSIILNNLKILIFCVLLSFFFGAGSIFILTWNASVVAAALGAFIRTSILSHINPSLVGYSHVVSLGVLKYFTHGVFEIVAYLVGALAGGIFSIAVVKHEFRTKEFRNMLRDSIDITALSVFLLLLAAFVEVFITPLIV